MVFVLYIKKILVPYTRYMRIDVNLESMIIQHLEVLENYE